MKHKIALIIFCLAWSVSAVADPISGYVNADGTVRLASSLYSVVHPSLGLYKIIFATAMEPEASCVIAPSQMASINVYMLKETPAACVVGFKLEGGGHKKVDASFSFIAVPMSD